MIRRTNRDWSMKTLMLNLDHPNLVPIQTNTA